MANYQQFGQKVNVEHSLSPGSRSRAVTTEGEYAVKVQHSSTKVSGPRYLPRDNPLSTLDDATTSPMNISKGSFEAGSRQNTMEEPHPDQFLNTKASNINKPRAKGKINRLGEGRGASGNIRASK